MIRVAPTAVVVLLVACLSKCSATSAPEPQASPSPSDLPPAPAVPAPSIAVEDVPVDNDLPAFVLRNRTGKGAGEQPTQMLFLSGLCAHPVGYVQSFQAAAAEHGDVVMLQADVSCGGSGALRRWSSDLEAMNRRIEAAFRASGLGEPRNVIVIGYSQGAERAERLVARWPARYTSAILQSSPVLPSPQNLGKAHGVVLMAGTLEAQGNMKNAVGPLRRAGVRSTFLELPGARHGQLGGSAQPVMAEALDFLGETDKVKK